MELQLTGSPVRDVQHMLNVLSFSHPAIPRLVEDGVFGERTLEGVMIFQRDFALPVTGVVDYDTWLALRVQTDLIAQRDGAPIPHQRSAPRCTPTAAGTPAGGWGQIQRLAQLPVTGVLDRPTWGILVRLYHALVVRGALSGAG